MKNLYIRTLLFISSFGLLSVSCDDNIDPLIEKIELDRALTPMGLRAFIRNQTTIELTWQLRSGVDHYVVEFSEDSLEFNSIIRTVTVMPDELPLQETFDGETRYSARIKAISATGNEDSKWAAITIMTNPEQIFEPLAGENITATTVTLNWSAASAVTHFIIVPGDIQRPITEQEKAAGEATIEGLTGSTQYTIKLFNNNKQRGSVTFATLIDVGDATLVYPEDDLSAVVAAASSGDILVLQPGIYEAYTGSITIDKSISIKGLYPYDKPVLTVRFDIESGAVNVELIDLELDGKNDAVNNPQVVRFNSTSTTYGSLLISGCNIHDYTHQLVYGNPSGSKVSSVTIDNSIITSVNTAAGGDFIDFRGTHVTDITVTNSTFRNCTPGRDFFRVDAAGGFNNTGLTSTILLDKCTIYGAATLRRFLYVRFVDNVLTVSNSLFAETVGYYSDQSATSVPNFNNNNYFNAPGFFDATKTRFDGSGTFTQLDPGFVNAANGDFTITNQTLIDNGVGDPRWRQ